MGGYGSLYGLAELSFAKAIVDEMVARGVITGDMISQFGSSYGSREQAAAKAIVDEMVARGVSLGTGGGSESAWQQASTAGTVQIQPGDRLIVSGSNPVIFPDNPAVGDWFEIVWDGSAGTDRLIQLPQVTNILGFSTQDLRLKKRGYKAKFSYSGTFLGWVSDSSFLELNTTSANLTWAYNGDGRGLFYQIGFDGQIFTNPQVLNKVVSSATSVLSGFVSLNLTDRDNRIFHSNSGANQSFTLQLLQGVTIAPNKYTIKSRDDDNSNHLRNWQLQGSNNGTTWDIINTQTNNSSLSSVAQWVDIPVSSSPQYSYFRILQTGNNSSGQLFLTCGEIELYGVAQNLKINI